MRIPAGFRPWLAVAALLGVTLAATAAGAGENRPPTASSLELSTAQDTTLTFNLKGSHPDDSSLSVHVLSRPINGNLSGTGPVLTYTPDPAFVGTDQLIFVVNDGTLDSPPATVSILVQPPDEPRAEPEDTDRESERDREIERRPAVRWFLQFAPPGLTQSTPVSASSASAASSEAPIVVASNEGGNEDNEGRGREKTAEHRGRGLAPDVKFVGVLRDGSRETTGVFLARQLDTLIIQLYWKNWFDNREMHYQRVQLITPDGAVYQTFTTDIHAFKHDGNPVEIEVPVTGSWIKAHKLFGAWRVDVFLDDEPLAIARQGFTILSSN